MRMGVPSYGCQSMRLIATFSVLSIHGSRQANLVKSNCYASKSVNCSVRTSSKLCIVVSVWQCSNLGHSLHFRLGAVHADLRQRNQLSDYPLGFGGAACSAQPSSGLGTIASVEFNKHTSTDKFCTSCHNHNSPTDAHASPPTDPHYLQSAHVSNSAGVRASCGQCHIPMNNFFVETFTHLKSGIRDVIAEMTTNFDDREAWNARRRELAKGVHEHMRARAT